MNCDSSRRLFHRHSLLLLASAACCRAGPVWAQAQEGVPTLQRPALLAPQSLRGALLAVALAGRRIIAVGERGIVLLSDDRGGSWRQVPVPVSVTLTAVRFVSEKAGWATGHGGVVLATLDGGETWTRQLEGRTCAELFTASAEAMQQRLGPDDPSVKRALLTANRLQAEGPDKPLLDLHFSDVRRGMVVGAYGLAFVTEDGGKTWESALERLDNPKGLHFNAITGDRENFVIAGEQGLVLRSTDGGKQFTRVEVPYRGSWFAVHVGAKRELALGGLQGNAFFSPDLGATWQKIDFDTGTSITSFVSGDRGYLFAANQAGALYVSKDVGRSFERLSGQGGAPLAGLVELGNDLFVSVGLRGLRRIQSRGRKL